MEKIVLGFTDEKMESEQRFFIFKRLYEKDHDSAYNVIHTLCDLINHLKDDKLLDCIALLEMLVGSDILNSIERLFIATSMYNNGFIRHSFDVFKHILTVDKKEYIAQTESIKRLYGSEEFDDIIAEFILEFIQNKSFSSEKRYNLLNDLFHMNGIKLYFNSQKIVREINYNMAYRLFSFFFFDVENDMIYRLLSVKKLIALRTLFDDYTDFTKIFTNLFEICNNEQCTDDDRYNAADTLYRSGSIQDQRRANDILVSLDRSKKSKSIYNNSQNVHSQSVLESVESFLYKLISDIEIKVDSKDSVVQSISQLIKESDLGEKEYVAAFKSLNRVCIDETIFTKYKFNLMEILCKVWKKIQLSEVKEFLKKRLIEELIDSSDWNTGCSTGIAARLVNVFSGIDDTITISWTQQIEGNFKGRVEAKIRDSDIQDELISGMLPNSDDRQLYLGFINSVVDEIKVEMKNEFSIYIKEAEFDQIFENTVKLWV
jgi:hypothetical protein